MRNHFTYLIVIFTLAFSSSVMAQVTYYWDCETAVPTSGSDPNLTISAVSQWNNNGTTPLISSVSSSKGYTGASGNSNFGVACFIGPIGSGFEFTITPATGYSFTIDEMSLGSRSTGTGPQKFTISYTADGGNGDIANYLNTGGGSAWVLYSFPGLNIEIPESIHNNLPVTILINGYDGSGGASMNIANWRIDDLTLKISSIILPVTFAEFNVKASKSASYLNFSTASETNNEYFTIERSADGRVFDAIGHINGAGNSNQLRNYTFIDEYPLSGISYYRIAQTDYDGKFSYSDIRTVRHTIIGSNFVITPRASDGRYNIVTDLEQYNVHIINSAGQEVRRYTDLHGSQSVGIETLQAGIYFFRIMTTHGVETIRVLKN